MIALPYLVMLKLLSSHKHALGDLSTMLGWASEEELVQIRKVVSRYMAEEKTISNHSSSSANMNKNPHPIGSPRNHSVGQITQLLNYLPNITPQIPDNAITSA